MIDELTFLSGKTVNLRGLLLSDLEGPYVSWLNDAEVCRYNSHHVFPYSREQAEDYIKSVYAGKTILALAIVLKESGEHIGNIALQNIHPLARSAEFAILVGAKDQWGKGFAKEAAKLICRHGFNELNLHRIYCGTNAENNGMQKLASYLGMQLEGRSREAQFKDGRFVDVLHYGLLRSEFVLKFRSADGIS